MSKDNFKKGLEIRKAVLGNEYVENSINNATEFNKPLQEMVTEYCWGYVWGRDGLSKSERSMINLSMIATLNRPHELALHVKGALRNGVSKEKIREILLQVGIYSGVPAAVDSFRIAAKAIEEFESDLSDKK